VVGETLATDNLRRQGPSIYLAGGIALRGPTGTVVGERAFAGRQGRRLFVRLATLNEPIAQADLADDLWGTDWPPAWQVALRALVSKLRATLARVGAPDAIVSRDGTYALRLPADSWLDIDVAARSIHQAEIALSDGDRSSACGWALAARAIASRPLLTGEEGEWLDEWRRRLDDIHLRSLECLGEVWLEGGDHALAAHDAGQAIAIDPFRESAHRLLIRAHLAAGDHGNALRAYLACRQLFRDELGILPAPETVALVTPLLARRGRASFLVAEPSGDPVDGPPERDAHRRKDGRHDVRRVERSAGRRPEREAP
jgi:DNA-binding SARP family transcriptional activator